MAGRRTLTLVIASTQILVTIMTLSERPMDGRSSVSAIVRRLQSPVGERPARLLQANARSRSGLILNIYGAPCLFRIVGRYFGSWASETYGLMRPVLNGGCYSRQANEP